MSEFAHILTKTTQQEIGNTIVEQTDYTWEDGTLAKVSRRLVGKHDVGDVVEIGPYVAVIVGHDCVSDSYIIQNVDSARSSFLALQYKIKQALAPIMYRLILTLAIWGLANYPKPGDYVGWYLVKERWL